MTNTLARWRSLLFVPAHVAKFVSRAHERGADGIILDLEDSVPAPEKEAARAGLADSVAQVSRHGASAMVRVNHGILALAPDLDAAVIPGVAALVLPKVESGSWVREIAAAVADLERERGLQPAALRFVLQIETPAALPKLHAIAAAHPRVAAMTLGPEDFCAALGAEPEPDALLAPNLAVLAAARAANVLPLGFVGSIASYSDPEAFRAMVRQARRLGFCGAMAVHPAQVAILNDGFAPTRAEIDWAQRVMAGDAEARAAGRGAFRLDGRMVDPPVVRRAAELLARAVPAQPSE
jgi:citrate lyase subunit beta/citryl-CoA lyase